MTLCTLRWCCVNYGVRAVHIILLSRNYFPKFFSLGVAVTTVDRATTSYKSKFNQTKCQFHSCTNPRIRSETETERFRKPDKLSVTRLSPSTVGTRRKRISLLGNYVSALFIKVCKFEWIPIVYLMLAYVSVLKNNKLLDSQCRYIRLHHHPSSVKEITERNNVIPHTLFS